ncbi:MAG: polysaccharide biosynthesis C-terminal domain-containing protein [Hungatella sp.]
MAYLGVLRGYFQGQATMVPTAVSQIFEQIVNAVISILAASSLFDMGMKSNLVYGSTEYAYAFGAAGGTIGTGVGAVTALLFLMFLMLSYRPVMKRQIRRDQTPHLESYGHISYILGITILPIVLSSVIYNISSVLDNYIFGNAMASLGREQEIASSWGVYMGKYHLLFNIPVAIANALSSSLIPSLSRAVAEKSRSQITAKISSAIRFSMVIAIPSAVGLTVLAAPISNLLFAGTDNTMLIRMTMLGSTAVIFFSLSTITNAVLQGINHLQIPIRNAAISLVLHVVILCGMLYGLKLGVYSVVYANLIFALVVCILNGLSIGRHLRYRQEIKKTFVIPTLASGVMGAVAYGSYQLCYQSLHGILGSKRTNLLAVVIAIGLAVIVYAVLLIKLRCVEEAELRGMPGGTKLARLARKLRLM